MQASMSGLFDRSPDGVVVFAHDRRVLYANPALARAAGEPPERGSAIGADVLEWLAGALGVGGSSRTALDAAIGELARGDADSFDHEIDVLRKRDERRRFLARGASVEIGGRRAILMQLQDASAPSRGERALESRFHLLQTIIDAIPSPIFFKDRAGVYAGCNKAFERYIGMPTERVIGSTVWDVAPKELADKYHEMDEALMQQRGVQSYEHGVRYADGSVHEVVFNKATFAGQDGEVAGLVGVMLDITERKHAEEETRKAVSAMEAAVKLKSRFLAVVSHEIRTPLNGVLGMLELLERSASAPEQQRMLAVARSSAEHLLYLLNNVLDFSKLEADKVEIEAHDFAVDDLVSTVTEAAARAAGAKGIETRHAIAPGVPAVVCGDGARLRQVLFNLVANAVKFTERGSVTVDVARAEGDPLRLRFEVRDTGPGIAPGARDRLFTEFAQADESIARRYGGTGLGLAISKRLVERMGGRLDCESAPGQGATFWFDVPLASARNAGRPLPLGAEPRTAPMPGTLRVLVVEDNHVNQLVVAGMLHALGHAARVVSNGAEAIAAVRNEPFDLVLMDLEMPEMTGLEATRAIRASASGARVPILAVTAHVLDGVAEQCRDAGMDGWISKPLRLDHLSCAIAACFAPLDASPSSRLVASAPPGEHAQAPSSIAPSEACVLDAARLDALAEMMGPDELARLLDEFLSSLAERQGALVRAIPGDPQAALLYAHSIKGMSDQVGATALAAVARRLEAALRDGGSTEPSHAELSVIAATTREAIGAPAAMAERVSLRANAKPSNAR